MSVASAEKPKNGERHPDASSVNATDLLEKLQTYKQSDEILDFVLDEENSPVLQEQCLTLIEFVGNKMCKKGEAEACEENGGGNDDDKDAWENYATMLCYVAKRCRPKEVLVGLLQVLSLANCRHVFAILLKSLHVTFVRLPGRNQHVLSETLVSIYQYFSRLQPDPIYEQMDDSEMPLLEMSSFLVDSQSGVSAVTDFCRLLISETRECKLVGSETQRRQQRLSLITFLLKLVEHPVSSFCLCNGDRFDPRFETAAAVVDCLLSIAGTGGGDGTLLGLIQDFDRGLLKLQSSSLERTLTVDASALGVLSALVLHHGMSPALLTGVHSHQFLLDILLPFITCLWTEDRGDLFMRHGLHIAEHFVQRLDVRFEPASLNCRRYQLFWLHIIHPLTCAVSDAVRQRFAVLFTRCLSQFPAADQMAIIRLIFSATSSCGDGDDLTFDPRHCAVRGFLIDYVRGQLSKELRCGGGSASDPSSPSKFSTFFYEAAHLFTYLPNREKTDFVFYYDQCAAALNFVRFISMISCSVDNASSPVDLDIGRVLKDVRSSFLVPLAKGIELASEQYSLQLKASSQANAKIAEGAAAAVPYTSAVEGFLAKLNLLNWLLADVNDHVLRQQ